MQPISNVMKFSPVIITFLLLLTGCAAQLPKGIDPVQNFVVDRYMGTWYEVARLDHRFERGLSNVSATYTVRDDGDIDVLNRGFNEQKQAWSEAKGKAKFVRSVDEGFLKVSFFGPFFGSYVVFDLDDAYTQAYVSGNDRSYLWFLARQPTITDAQKEAFVKRAEALGFPVAELIFVDQSLGDRP